MSMTSIRPRGIGEIFDGAFRLYREDFGLYLLTALLGAVPWAILMVGAMGDSTGAAALVLLMLPVGLVLTATVWGALVHQMNTRLDGAEPTFGASMKYALSRFFPIVFGGFFAYLSLMIAMLIVGLGGALAAVIGGFVHSAVGVIAAIVVAIGLGLAVGMRLLAASFLFLPGVVVERLGGYRAVRRGYDLAVEGRGRVVTVVFISWILIFVPFTATYFLTGTTAMLLDPEAIANGVVSTGQFALQQLLGVITSGFTTPFLVACILLSYYDQRVRLEAYDLEAEAEALGG